MEANKTMKLSDVETLFEQRLQVAGIDSYLDRHRSQFLDVGESFFVELVFTEGEKLAVARKGLSPSVRRAEGFKRSG